MVVRFRKIRLLGKWLDSLVIVFCYGSVGFFWLGKGKVWNEIGFWWSWYFVFVLLVLEYGMGCRLWIGGYRIIVDIGFLYWCYYFWVKYG